MKKTALITGGTSGIGKEFAHQLAQRGYDIIIVGRNKTKGTEITKTLKKEFGVQVEFLSADLSTKSGIKIVEENIKTIKNLEFLVNNAGFGVKKKFLDIDIQKWEDMINVHNTATMRLSYQSLRIMQKNKEGHIINVASLAAYLNFGSPLYTATKAFIKTFSLNLYYEFAKQGVYIQALCPGYVRTNFFDNAKIKKPSKNVMSTKKLVSISLKYVEKKKGLCIPGKKNKLIKALLNILPNRIVYHLIKKHI